MLSTKVILSNVTNLSEARYAAGMGVDYIAFNINPNSDRFVTPQKALEISQWVNGVSIIGNIEDNQEANPANYKTDYIQTSSTSLISLNSEPIFTINVNKNNIDEVLDLMGTVRSQVLFFIFVIDNHDLVLLKEKVAEICSEYQVYISTPFDAEILGLLGEMIMPAGIVIYGNTETKPGLSDYDGIADVLELLEVDY